MSETRKIEIQDSEAFEAIKPELIAFLRANLRVSVDVGGYDGTTIEVSVFLGGEEISSGCGMI